MAWVEITDPEHVIRKTDQISDYGTQWYGPSDLTGALGKKFGKCGFAKVRCRRKELPPIPQPVETPSTPDPGEGWRLIDKNADTPMIGDVVWNEYKNEWEPRYLEFDSEPFNEKLIYRRRITPTVETPTEKIRLRLWVPRRVLQTSPTSDLQVRFSHESVKKFESWSEVFWSPEIGFYVEKPQ